MNCENCGHKVLEPIISEYCTNCGRPTSTSKAKLVPDREASLNLFEPKFIVREWNSAFFPGVASIIPVLVLSYFAAGTVAAIILTSLDFLFALWLYLRTATFEFFDDRLRILSVGRVAREIRYSELEKIDAVGSGIVLRKYEGSFILLAKGPQPEEIEIPSNPKNPELGIDLISWLSAKVAAERKHPTNN
jgi:hypothetical protein